jgi:transcriptional regulator with PAS, ATPase and Fis domain
MSITNPSATDLARFFDGGAAPVYLLDEDRQLVFYNEACAAWLGTSAEALLGQRCNYHTPAADGQSPSEPAALVAGLCPPPEVFSGKPMTALVSCFRCDGRVVHRRGHFLPLAAGEDESAPVIAVLETVDCTPEASQPGDESCQELHELVRRFRQQLAGSFVPDRLIGNSPPMLRARAQIELAASANMNVLISGPVGSGKEHAAKAIHYGQREPGLLVPLDCAVMEENLLRSTFRTLCLRRNLRPANSTLLLEHVSSMPAGAQQELAEILREGSLQMRVLSTTSKPLRQCLEEEALSEELAYALSTLVIELPPLNERIDDLPVLLQAQVEQLNATQLRQITGFSPEAIDQLAAYPWSGNLNELEALVRQLHEKAQAPLIQPRDLPRTIHWRNESPLPARGDEPIVLEQFLAAVEKELIARAMRRSKGNKSRAAKLLGLTRPRLYRRLVQLGLEPPKQDAPQPPRT